jgi:hypothetical protein
MKELIHVLYAAEAMERVRKFFSILLDKSKTMAEQLEEIDARLKKQNENN